MAPRKLITSFEKNRCIGQAGERFVSADLLHLQNIDAVLFLAHGKCKKMLAGFFAGGRRTGADCGVRCMGE